MAFDVTRWLTEDMGFSAEKAADMAPMFAADKLEKTHGLMADLTVRASEITRTQAELKTANDRLNAEMAEWASLTAREKEQATALQSSLEAARVRATQLESRLTTLATEHGVDPKALLEGTAVIPDKKPEPVVPAIDTSKFVTVEAYGALSNYLLTLPAQLSRIEREHFTLTGEHVDAEAIVNEVKVRAGKKDANVDPIAIWEEKYGIADKRAAKAKADHEAEIKAAEMRGEERARTAAAVPGTQTPGRHAPVFGNRDGQGNFVTRTSKLARPAPESTVRAAAQALASHKYRHAS